MNLTEFLGRQNKAILAAIAIVLLAAVIVADFASAPEFEASVFYLIPISFFAWFLGRRLGLMASLVSDAIAFVMHRSHFPYHDSRIVYWNTLAWLAVYLFFAIIISDLRDLLKAEQASSRTDAVTGTLTGVHFSNTWKSKRISPNAMTTP